MKKIITVFLSVAFLSFLFSGSAFCEPPVMDDGESTISKEELKEGESILDMLVPDEAEAAPFNKDAGDPYEENLHKGDELPFLESDKEDDKGQEEEEKSTL